VAAHRKKSIIFLVRIIQSTFNALAQVKEVRYVAYKQLFADRLHVKMIELISDKFRKQQL